MQKNLQFCCEPQNAQALLFLCGGLNAHLEKIAQDLQVSIHNRGYLFHLQAEEEGRLAQARWVLESLYAQALERPLTLDDVHLALRDVGSSLADLKGNTVSAQDEEIQIPTKRGLITGRGANQRRYLRRIFQHAVNFGIGPAGTGKTYLAVASAVAYLAEEKVRKIILVRPAVEAGERLGFLPGDMSQKVDPYLRPLYDALHDMLGVDRVAKLIERGTIEIAPLAFMRGRTLNEAFIILDEAQNTTVEQIKMFLTRQGFGSTSVITGDPSQIDLARGQVSGLQHAQRVLRGVEGISFTHFLSQDVVRHPLVQRIIDAYSAYEATENKEQRS